VRGSLVGGALLLSLLVPPSLAGADRASAHTQRKPLSGKQRQDFWGWLLDPHKAEVDEIMRLAAENWQQAASDAADYEAGTRSPARAERRRRALADAEGMLKYALKLSPGRSDVLRQLALVQDENDQPGAQKTLERYLAAEIPDRVTAEPRVRLARWYARQRRYGDAIVQLRLALGSPLAEQGLRAQALHLYATVLMHSDRLAEAIDLLQSAAASNPTPQTVFALAVAYDRDEQITRALETLESLRAMNTTPFADVLLQQERGRQVVFVPPWERHYYTALQYELLGYLPEARSEWQAYIRCDEAPYRERARQHLVLVDRLAIEQARAAKRAARKPAAPPPAAPVIAPGGVIP
jgi:tetratricopeptide (TPR) repeat protein